LEHPLARNNYNFEKRQRELNKERKKEEKRQRKLQRKEPEGEGADPDAEDESGTAGQASPGE
jgi:hypothetical protein